MAAPKGHKFAKGRPKGALNKRTEQWEKFSQWMLGAGLEKFQKEIQKLDGPALVRVMVEMMEYFQPKLARSEVTGKDGGPVEIEEVNPKVLSEKEKMEYLAKILGVYKG